MKIILISLLALFGFSSAGLAADANGPEVYHWGPNPANAAAGTHTWAGAYVGVNGATGFGQNSFAERGVGAASDPDSFTGAFGGLTAGLNTELGSIVAGAEGDIDLGNLKADSRTSSNFTCSANDCRTDVHWLSTLRARLGYEISDQMMIYATGGLAYGGVDAMAGNPLIGNASGNALGWTVGVGLEAALSENVSVKAEALYVDLGRLEIGAPCSTQCYSDVNFALARVGVNYRF